MRLQRLSGAIAAVWLMLAPAQAAEQSSYVAPTAGPMNMESFVGTYLNPALRALATCSWGSSAPANGPGAAVAAQQCWWDTSGTPYVLKWYIGAQWVAVANVNASTHAFTLPNHIIGTDVQGYNANLAAIAGLTTAANKCAYWTGSGTAALIDCLSWARTFIAAADAAAGRTALGVAIGTDVQAYNARLAAIAAFASTANRLYGADGSGNGSLITLPAAGLSLSAGALALANDLAAVEGLSSNGCAARTATDTWAVRTVTGTTNQITVTNGDCVSGNPTISIPSNAALPGAPTTTTASPNDNSTKIATTAYVDAAVIVGASGVASFNGQTGAVVSHFAPQGRITLVSGTPVMTTSTTGATTIYYTPDRGTMVPLYNGTNTVPTAFTELSITLGNNWTSSTNYDVFIASDSGTTRACTGPAWTAGSGGSATARGTGAGGTELERVSANGLLMNKVQITCRYTNSSTFTVAANRGTYVGTVWIRAADSTIDWHFGGAASGGTAGTFGVWNMYNRREFTAQVEDTFSSASVNQAAPSALNASNNNRINYVIGWAEDSIVAKTFGTGVAGSGGFVTLGVGHDTTTAISGLTQAHAANIAVPVGGSARFNGDLGFHYVQAVQAANVSNGTIYGSGTVANFHTGIEMSGQF